jgi:eukaryotic-like serine/threonine-protein kinase
LPINFEGQRFHLTRTDLGTIPYFSDDPQSTFRRMVMTSMPANNAEPDIESLERIFQLVADAPESRQDSLLAELCPDLEVQGLVRSLLKADSSDGLVIDKELFSPPVELNLGEQIGPYKLLQKIGEGGMGVVYMAEQSVPVRRKVALKIIKPGADSKQVLARFAAERQALSMMEHPNIAQVFDAGATESGRPYFAMELVKGRSITHYCQEQQLSIRERLELLMTVCHAIQHAHQKGIIHRDLKPSNVLVTEYDGRPVAKVIDFGVAKAIENPLTEITLFTGFGQIVGTLEYMSPEQSRMNQLDVDVRSDVYSLGVLIYELITGSTPIAKERLRTAAWDEMLRIIREEDPPLPSTRLSDWERDDRGAPEGSAQATNSQVTRTRAERQKLSRLVRGELDWIVMKSLEKDRSRRYASPGEMAKDIHSFLTGDVVSACPPSMLYRLQKTFKRHKLAVLTTGLVALALILGLAGTTWQAWRATKAERIANVERDFAKEQAEKAAKAERLAQVEATKLRIMDEFFQTDLLGLEKGTSLLLPGETSDPNLTLGQLLDRARKRLNENHEKYGDQSNNRRQVKLLLVRSYSSIGRLDEATSLLEEIVAELKNDQGDQNVETLQYVGSLAQLYIQQYRWWDALACYEEAYLGRQRLLGEQDPRTLGALHNVANILSKLGFYEQSVVNYRLRLKLEQQSQGDAAPWIAEYQAQLGRLLAWLGEPEEANELMLQAISYYRQQQNVPKLQQALTRLGMACLQFEQFSEAKRALAEACDLSNQPGIADGYRSATQFAYAVACLMAPSSDAQGAAPLPIQDAFKSFIAHSPITSAPVADDLQLFASCLQRKGKLDQAEQFLRLALAIIKRYSIHGTRRSEVLADLADISNHRGDHQKTKELLLQAVECLADTERYPSKYNQTPEFEAARDKLFKTLADRLVQVHQELGDDDGAKTWQTKMKTGFKVEFKEL